MEGLRKKLKCTSSSFAAGLYLHLTLSSGNGSTIFQWIVLAITFTYPLNNTLVLVQNLDSFDVVTNTLVNIVGGTIGFAKTVVVLLQKNKLVSLTRRIERMSREQNISYDQAYTTNKLTLGALVTMNAAFVYFFISTITVRLLVKDASKWSLPMADDVAFVNRTYSPNYEICWCYVLINVSFLANWYILANFLVASLISDECVLLKVLQEHIVSSIKIARKEGDEREKRARLHATLKDIVRRHLAIIDMMDDTEDICSKLIFLDVLGSTLMICFSVYCASLLPLFDFRALQMYLEFVMVILSLFFVCYRGTELVAESEAVADACYESNFVDTNVDFQKGLNLVILRSQRPMKITVGKFTTLSMVLFVAIMRSSYTYFMVLNNTNDMSAANF